MEELIIEQATAVSQADVAAIAALGDVLHQAGTTAPTTPTTHDTAAMDALRQALEVVIAAENQVLLLARLDGKVVGMATLALLVGPIAGRKIYLDDFVTDPSVQGKGGWLAAVGCDAELGSAAWCDQAHLHLQP